MVHGQICLHSRSFEHFPKKWEYSNGSIVFFGPFVFFLNTGVHFPIFHFVGQKPSALQSLNITTKMGQH